MPGKPSSRTQDVTPEKIEPLTQKAQGRKLLPGATIYGVCPDSTEYVAWDGEQYAVYQTKERVLADDSLILIGSVQDLRVDRPHPGRIDRVEVVIPTPKLTDGRRDQGPEPKPVLQTIYSAPLSTFEATVGKLMVEARRACPSKYLPATEIMKIAALLDDENVPVRSNLEREAAQTMAEYNKQHPKAAIKSWRTALSHPKFRRAVRKRFSRAEEKYRKTDRSIFAVSAGTPRTGI